MVGVYRYVGLANLGGYGVACVRSRDEGLNIVVSDIFFKESLPYLGVEYCARFHASYRAVTVDYYCCRVGAKLKFAGDVVFVAHHREGIAVLLVE